MDIIAGHFETEFSDLVERYQKAEELDDFLYVKLESLKMCQKSPKLQKEDSSGLEALIRSITAQRDQSLIDLGKLDAELVQKGINIDRASLMAHSRKKSYETLKNDPDFPFNKYFKL